MTRMREELGAFCLEAALQIASECLSCAEEKPEDGPSTAGLRGCGMPLVRLLERQAQFIVAADTTSRVVNKDDASGAAERCRRRLADLLDVAHARFYAYAPSDVPACWRQLYTDVCILQFAQRYRDMDSRRPIADALEALVCPLDMALILAGGAGPPHRGRAWIHAALEALHGVWETDGEGQGESLEGGGGNRPMVHDWSACPAFATTSAAFTPPVSRPVPRSGPLGLEGFQAYLDRGRQSSDGRDSRDGTDRTDSSGPRPLIMTGLTDHWPARRADGRPWAAPAYLWWRTLGGRRLVPVEIGRSYVDAGWTQAVVPMADVLAGLGWLDHGGHEEEDKQSETMYLAQHALFTQMPLLRDDIRVPDECYTATGSARDTDADEPLLHAWLGPPGTITPLHTDPHHNLLAQVVGRKYVRLYSPAQTAALQPRGREGGVNMDNTSTLDVGTLEGWDTIQEAEQVEEEQRQDRGAELDLFRQIPYVDCILEPGDTLYIPRGWWHYVRGLTVSFSVSFWWD